MYNLTYSAIPLAETRLNYTVVYSTAPHSTMLYLHSTQNTTGIFHKALWVPGSLQSQGRSKVVRKRSCASPHLHHWLVQVGL